jgi:hypothetical protein
VTQLDRDCFDGRPVEGVTTTDTARVMRRMIKEDLRMFEGSRCSPTGSPKASTARATTRRSINGGLNGRSPRHAQFCFAQLVDDPTSHPDRFRPRSRSEQSVNASA